MQKFKPKPDDKKVVVIGAGPAGLTAAHELAKADMAFLLLEKDLAVGGISKTLKYKNFYFDLGGHRFFTRIKEVEELWRKVLGHDFLQCKRFSRIYFKKKFIHYPLRPLNSLFSLGLWNCFLIHASYLYSHLFPSKKEDTFEQWITNRFGKRLYQTFFKAYTEKILGISCSELRSEWAAQRIQGLNLFSALEDAFTRDRNNGGRGPAAKTLTDSFNYPKFGPGMMWEAMAKTALENGSGLSLGTKVEEILWEQNRIKSLFVIQNHKRKEIQGTHFISSMPITELIRKLKPQAPEEVLNASNALKYRGFIMVALVIHKRDIFPDHWIYIHDVELKLGRIQNFKNWSPVMVPDPDKTCLGLEYFCFEGDELWSLPDEELIELGKKELERLGFARMDEVEDGIVARVPKAYPIYDSNYREALRVIARFLGTIENIQLVGRNGLHQYNNMDHSMLTAMLAIENIMGAKHDLWDVSL